MPDNQRLALQLRDIQGLDFDDICNIMDVSASNVRVLLHRVRARLFEMVDRFQETGEC
jgi:RNA polymerase sigma-70 factor (ECF subfamily)